MTTITRVIQVPFWGAPNASAEHRHGGVAGRSDRRYRLLAAAPPTVVLAGYEQTYWAASTEIAAELSAAPPAADVLAGLTG